jgi:hypothetical protein
MAYRDTQLGGGGALVNIPMNDQIPKRLSPTHETYRELFLKSGNLCAFPGCHALLIDQDGTFVGQLCHIEAAELGGARFNSAMTNDERRAAPNLILMCYPHHQVTNDIDRYSVADLRAMKAAHQTRFCSRSGTARPPCQAQLEGAIGRRSCRGNRAR